MSELRERALDHAVNLVNKKQTLKYCLGREMGKLELGHFLGQKNQKLRKDDVKTRKNAEGNLNVSFYCGLSGALRCESDNKTNQVMAKLILTTGTKALNNLT